MGRLPYLALVVWAQTAYADGADKPLSTHDKQFGLSARLGLGVRGIATYDTAVYCGATDTSTTSGFAPVCTGRSPVSLDLEASYGIARSIELTLEMRIGFEQDF